MVAGQAFREYGKTVLRMLPQIGHVSKGASKLEG